MTNTDPSELTSVLAQALAAYRNVADQPGAILTDLHEAGWVVVKAEDVREGIVGDNVTDRGNARARLLAAALPAIRAARA